jgi:hypothetical protein
MSLGFSNNDVRLGQNVTYSSFVLSAHSGPTAPTGSVQFVDHGAPIGSCASQPVFPAGGTFEATCTQTYSSVGAHSITAVYTGDRNFGGSSAGPVTIPVNVVGIIGSPMRWRFAPSAKYTKVLALAVKAVPAGALVTVTCKGKGCPYAVKRAAVKRSGATVKLAKFNQRQLRPGTKIVVYVVRTGWIGKYYGFRMRAKRTPQVTSGCLAPGTKKPTAC